MDDDLQTLDRESLIGEVKKLRAGIRQHRDSTGHDLCWHHPNLWDLLAGKDRSIDCRAAMAEIHARLHPIPPVARQAGATRACP